MTQIIAVFQGAVVHGFADPHLIICLLLFAFSVTGCSMQSNGHKRVAVHGEVKLDGLPLEAGVIKFIPAGESAGPVAVLPIKSGHYKCQSSEGPMEGVCRVEIDGGLDNGIAELGANPKRLVEHLKKNGAPKPRSPIPSIYNRQSVLTAELDSSADNDLDFDLLTPGSGLTSR